MQPRLFASSGQAADGCNASCFVAIIEDALTMRILNRAFLPGLRDQ